MDWISLLQTLGGIAGGLGIGLFTKAGRKKDMADADSKVQEAQRLMIENYEMRIKELHENKKKLNEEADYYIDRISKQDHALESKTEQIRNLTQKLWETEQEVNRVNNLLNRANERITALTEERDNFRNWHCRKGSCPHREPPNPGLQNQTFHSN